MKYQSFPNGKLVGFDQKKKNTVRKESYRYVYPTYAVPRRLAIGYTFLYDGIIKRISPIISYVYVMYTMRIDGLTVGQNLSVDG